MQTTPEITFLQEPLAEQIPEPGVLLRQADNVVRHGAPPEVVAGEASASRHISVILPSSPAREMMNDARNDATEHHFRVVNPASIEPFRSINFHECSQVTSVDNPEEKNMNPYPTTADLSRERDAHRRDCDDLWTLQQLRRIVAGARDCAAIHDPIRHPDRRWQVEDLLEALSEQLANIDATAAMIRDAAPVLEEV